MEHTVLVTGSTAGFGEATTRRFLAHGHQVIALGRRVERLESLKASLPPEQQKKLLTMAVDVCDRMIDTNIKGLVHMTRAFLPGMVDRQCGHVINLGSVAANYPYPGGNVYGGTKAFVQQFSLNLRADLIGTPVRVTCLEPGMCAGTEFSNVRFKGDDAKAQTVYSGVKSLSADDIAEAIFWAATLPSHMNVNLLELMPVQQAFGAFSVHRGEFKV